MEEQSLLNDLFDLSIDGDAQRILYRIASWARIIAVAGFAGIFLSLVRVVISFYRSNPAIPAESAALSPVLYRALLLGSAVVGVVLNIILLRFANTIRYALNAGDQEQFDSGVNTLRLYYRITGILIIVALVIGIFAIVLATFASSP